MAVVREKRRLKELKKRGDAIVLTGFGLAGAAFYGRWKEDFPWPVVWGLAASGAAIMVAGWIVRDNARQKLAEIPD